MTKVEKACDFAQYTLLIINFNPKTPQYLIHYNTSILGKFRRLPISEIDTPNWGKYLKTLRPLSLGQLFKYINLCSISIWDLCSEVIYGKFSFIQRKSLKLIKPCRKKNYIFKFPFEESIVKTFRGPRRIQYEDYANFRNRFGKWKIAF